MIPRTIGWATIGSVLLILIPAIQTSADLGLPQNPFDKDPTLPPTATWDVSIYYVINATGVTKYQYGVQDHAIQCTGQWLKSVTTQVVPTTTFIQGYLFNYHTLKVEALAENQGTRETHDYTCSAGIAITTGPDQFPASSCGGASKDPAHWTLVGNVTAQTAVGASKPFDMPGPNQGVWDLSGVSNVCIDFLPATGATAVGYTGRLNLTVSDAAAVAWRTTTLNTYASHTFSPDFSCSACGSGAANLPDARISIWPISVFTLAGDVLPPSLFGGTGDWRAQIYVQPS